MRRHDEFEKYVVDLALQSGLRAQRNNGNRLIGSPDLTFRSVGGPTYHIELKVPPDWLSPEQRWAIKFLREVAHQPTLVWVDPENYRSMKRINKYYKHFGINHYCGWEFPFLPRWRDL